MRRLAHIVNPVIVPATSDLYLAQPITFSSMRQARDLACGRVDVTLLTTQYPEDRPLVPDWFLPTQDLDRSVQDLGDFRSPRKLPLLQDILARAYEGSDAEYLIYTNVDIGLMPHFYLAVSRLIDQGYDALAIHRRTVSGTYRTEEDIPLIWTELGEDHPGHDCFVFRRELYPQMELGRVCLGARFVMRPLVWQLAGLARRFAALPRRHLTFHLGNDRAWLADQNAEFAEHNFKEVLSVLSLLETRHGAFGADSPAYPYVQAFRRYAERYREVGRHHRRATRTASTPLLLRRWLRACLRRVARPRPRSRHGAAPFVALLPAWRLLMEIAG